MHIRFTAMLSLCAVLATPTTAATPAERSAETVSDAQFAANFAHFERLPTAPAAISGAVDLDTFDPPVEAEPASTSLGSGVASYYGRKFNGRLTASGERFDMNGLTAAHRTLPFGSRVQVTNRSNGLSVVVRINDRGPFHAGRTIDLSRAAAEKIGLVGRGHGDVELALLD